jgi:phage tail-like protein
MPLPKASVSQSAQRLPSYLPAIYRDDPFLSRYLWAFEQVLLVLEQQIGDLSTLFDPAETRDEFLPWLSSWVAFTLRADLELPQQRAFIARIIPLYRRRGTKQNLQDLLSIFTRGTPTITEFNADDGPHFFRITMRLPHAAPAILQRQSAIAHALIDLEKPAHTDFDLLLLFPSMQIGTTSTIGVDTLLGTGSDTDTSGAIAASKFTPNQQP